MSVSHGFVVAPCNRYPKPLAPAVLLRQMHTPVAVVPLHRFISLQARKNEQDYEDDHDGGDDDDNGDNGDEYDEDLFDEEKQLRYYRDIDDIVEAVKLHNQLYGTLNVNRAFVVPENQQWPKHLWGLKLGQRLLIYSKQKRMPRSVKSKLDAVGYNIDVADVLDPWDVFLVALKAYKKVYDSVDVKTTFRVPKSKEWPAETHGYPLGGRVAMVKSIGRFVLGHPDRKQILDRLGFVWETGADMKRIFSTTWGHIRQALFELRQDDQSEFGLDLIMPSDNETHPDIRGMRIGEIYYNIQNNADAFYESTFAQKIIKEIGNCGLSVQITDFQCIACL